MPIAWFNLVFLINFFPNRDHRIGHTQYQMFTQLPAVDRELDKPMIDYNACSTLATSEMSKKSLQLGLFQYFSR
jgi:hypothetical protein